MSARLPTLRNLPKAQNQLIRPPLGELVPRTLELATADSRTFADVAQQMASSVLRTIAAVTAKNGASHPEQTSVLAGMLGSWLDFWQPPSTEPRHRSLSVGRIPTCSHAGAPACLCSVPSYWGLGTGDQGFPRIAQALLSRGYSFKHFSLI